MATTYCHAFTVAFEVRSATEDGSDITPEQFAQAIRSRVDSIMRDGNMIECVGAPFDTYKEGC